jgi:hypothetical protein
MTLVLDSENDRLGNMDGQKLVRSVTGQHNRCANFSL